MSTRATRKAETRAALKFAARTCFVRDGAEATSIGAITKTAGVAHGTFYVHFDSKEAVQDELLADFNDAFVTRLVAAWGQRPGALDHLVGIAAEVFLDTWLEERDFVAACAQRLATGVTLSKLRDGINPQAADLLARLLPDHTRLDPALASQALLVMWARIGLQFLFNDEVSRERALDTLVPMTLGALGGRP